MIGLARGQQLCGRFRVRHGMRRCTLYLLTGGIAVEAHGRGTMLEISKSELTGAAQKSGELVISWAEGGKILGIRMRTKEAREIARQIREGTAEKIP